MFDILTILPGSKRPTSGGWVSFNAICCQHRGHNADKKCRGGVKQDGDNWVYHCFNCNFTCKFELGQTFSTKLKQLLGWTGMDETDIQKYNLESLRYRTIKDSIGDMLKKPTRTVIGNFPPYKFQSPDIVKLDTTNPEHSSYTDYLVERAIDTTKYDFFVSPTATDRYKNRVIIPYYYRGQMIGCTSRFMDNKFPKYLNEQPSGFVFNIDAQKSSWQFCIVMEGIFDALSVDGVAVMHNDITQQQHQLLLTLNRPLIFVPDMDKTGLTMCEHALSLGYKVSIPPWDTDVKDVNDAVKRYGKFATILSILQNATTSKIKVELLRKKIANRLHPRDSEVVSVHDDDKSRVVYPSKQHHEYRKL